MKTVSFEARGHQNVIGEHRTTIEITSESHLTKMGTCILGVDANLTLHAFDSSIKKMAASARTQIVLRMTADGIQEEVIGTGSRGLTYENAVGMVIRTSPFECDRTLMVSANKAASDLSREFIHRLTDPDCVLKCEIEFISE